jgi:hypothetical protein
MNAGLLDRFLQSQSLGDGGADDDMCGEQIPHWLRALVDELSWIPTSMSEALNSLASKGVTSLWMQRGGRHRYIFPLPLCTADLFESVVGVSREMATLLAPLASASIQALNVMYGFRVDAYPESCHSSAQRKVLETAMLKTYRMFNRLKGVLPPEEPWKCLAELVGPADGRNTSVVPLCADKCDVLRKSGQVDPLPSLPVEMREIVSDPTRMFPANSSGLEHFASVPNEQHEEYLQLLVRELTSGKTALTDEARGGGDSFCDW